MLFCWLHLTSCLTLIWVCSPTSAPLCPAPCRCRSTERGRRKVLCADGGMSDPIPTSEMDAGTEVVEITAPESDPNSLTLSPLFQRLKKLEELHIRRSRLQQIGAHPFWGVPSLRVLDLSFNELGGVVDHNFRGLVNLVELNLDENRIGLLGVGVFRYLTELRVLSMQKNLVEEMEPRVFSKLGKLRVLKLSGNKLEELNPEVFKDVPELRILECRSCSLRRINTQIYHLLPYLNHLDLGDNQMQFISSDEFHDLRHLHTLKLDGNQLPVILERTFVRQQELKYLCLARNRLAKITDNAFLNTSLLQDLDIGFNKLVRLEMTAVRHVEGSLQRLVLSGNQFGADIIKDILNTVINVKDLGLAYMNLGRLKKGLVPDRVHKLDLSYNNLTELEVGSLPKQLQELDLSGNLLSGVQEASLLKLETLKVLKLEENPWSCRLCELGAVLLRINKSEVFKNVTCASPKKLKGRLLSTLHYPNLPTCAQADVETSKIDGRIGLVLGIASSLGLFVVCIVFAVSCFRRRSRNAMREQKRRVELQQENSLDHPVAIFSKGEISFKFPLDLTERRVEVSTIDEIKKDTRNVPNGTGI